MQSKIYFTKNLHISATHNTETYAKCVWLFAMINNDTLVTDNKYKTDCPSHRRMVRKTNVTSKEAHCFKENVERTH